MVVRYIGEHGINARVLGPGDSYHFPPGCIHQEEAVTDCTVIEVSTPHANDREGMEEEYGLEVPDEALPSTPMQEITTLKAWW